MDKNNINNDKNNLLEKKIFIIISNSFQNDFCEKLTFTPDKYELLSKKVIDKHYNHNVHVNYEETERLWRNKNVDNFFENLVHTAKTINNDETKSNQYHFIHIRDWHDNTKEDQIRELEVFGDHCIEGTHGVKFVPPIEKMLEDEFCNKYTLIVNSNSLNSFVDSNLENELNKLKKVSISGKDFELPNSNIYIGIVGLITNIKIQFLAYDLSINYNYENVYICKDLTAAFSFSEHELGLKDIKNVMVENLGLEDFYKKFEIIKV